jgi:hypothetical protein
MKPIEFPEFNTTFAKNQPEYLPLPAHVDKEEGIVTTCWRLNYIERLKILFGGKMYLSTMTFNKPLQPQLLLVGNPIATYNKNKK